MAIYSPDVQVDNPVTVSGGIIDASGSSVSVSNFPATQPVSGTVNVGNFPATQPISGTVSVAGTVNVITANASSATVAQVVMATSTNTTLLASNVNRKSAIIFIPTQPVFVKFGATASATSFTYSVTANSTTVTVTGYTGQIDAFGHANTVNVTELI